MPFVTVNSKSLFYTVTPPAITPTSVTLVFIHGLGSSSSFYAPIIPHLTSLGYRCLTFDTHGSGLSTYTGSGNSIDSIALDVCALLDSLDIKEDVVVVGHSMGGIVASHLIASDKPSGGIQKRFKAAVLIGPVHPTAGAAELFRKRIDVVEKDGTEPLAASIPVAATGSKSTPLIHAFIRSLILGTSPAGYVSLCKAIAEAPVPQYAAIKVPLLVIAGSEDKSAPIEGVTQILSNVESEKKELKVLQGVGHWHVLEAYQDVQEYIGGFLKDLS